MAAPRHSSLADKIEAVRSKWGWFVAAGVALAVLGIVALGNVLAAAYAVVTVTGAMMIVAGAVQFAHAFGAKTWGHVVYWAASGVLYVLAGGLTFANPSLAAAVFTLLLAAAVFAVGVMRVITGFDARPAPGWGWMVIGGVLTIVLAVLIWAGWPGNSIDIIGILLGIDLIFQGVAWVGFGLGIRPR